MTTKIRRLNLGKLFYNDKFAMMFSVLVSFILWLTIASSNQETTIFTVTDIPVTLPELTNDLRYFNTEGRTAEVKISGNAIVVASVTGNDIYITAADVSALTSPGTYTLNLVPKKSGLKTDYNFESTVTPSSIDVYIDKFAEREITINDKVSVSSVGEDYYVSKTVLSQQTVKVSGAESVINSIAEANAEYTFSADTQLTQTTSVSVPIVFYDAAGNEVTSPYITADISSVDATIPILSVKALPVRPNIINMPDALVLDSSRITINPSVINIAVPGYSADEVNEIATEVIDFSEVNLNKTKFSVNVLIPTDCRNLDNVETVDVTFDLSEYASKTVNINSFSVINQGSEQSVSVTTKSLSVMLIGPAAQISAISPSNVTAVIDMSERSSFIGSVEVPVTININSKFSGCWVFGSQTADITAVPRSANSSPPSQQSSHT